MLFNHKDKEAEDLAHKACIEAAKRMKGDMPALMLVEQLLTKEERIRIGRRLLIAQAILHGKTRYEINELLSVSPNTYTQVIKWLNKDFSEYTPKPKKVSGPKKTKEFSKPFTYEDMKRRYPMHFLLFTAAEKLFSKK